MINCMSKKLEYLEETEKFLKTHILPNLTPIENLNTSMRSKELKKLKISQQGKVQDQMASLNHEFYQTIKKN